MIVLSLSIITTVLFVVQADKKHEMSEQKLDNIMALVAVAYMGLELNNGKFHKPTEVIVKQLGLLLKEQNESKKDKSESLEERRLDAHLKKETNHILGEFSEFVKLAESINVGKYITDKYEHFVGKDDKGKKDVMFGLLLLDKAINIWRKEKPGLKQNLGSEKANKKIELTDTMITYSEQLRNHVAHQEKVNVKSMKELDFSDTNMFSDNDSNTFAKSMGVGRKFDENDALHYTF